MNSRLKIITTTAVATTLFWVAAIGLVFWLAPKSDDRIQAQFLSDKGAFGAFDFMNTKTQSVVLVIEALPTDSGATNRVELARRELAPRQRFRVGIRQLVESEK